MECNCRDNMYLVNREEVHEWNDDLYDLKIFENWECGSCGKTEQVDNTEILCENPY